MSLVSHQSAVNPKKNFWLASDISTITVQELTTQNLSVTGEGTISSISTNALELDGAYLTVSGSNLLLNGVIVATTSNLSSLSDWALDPAIANILPLNTSIDIGAVNNRFQTGYFSTINANFANIASTTLTLTETVSSLFVNDLFASSIVTQDASISSLTSAVAQISSLNAGSATFLSTFANSGNFSTINSLNGTFSNLTVSTANISSITGAGSASNWFQFPAKGDVLFQPDIFGNFQYSLSSVKDITCGNITAQLYGFPVPVLGGTVSGLLGNFGTVLAPTGTFSNNTETALVEVYGVNKAPGFNALYVNGGFTVDGGVATHGITLGTNTAGVSLNRIDILPIGTQDYVTWGAMAHVAGLGMTLDAGLGINIASGLVVDILSQDVQLRANDTISLDADDGISQVTGGAMTISADSVTETAKNFTFTDSNFTINSSNENIFNAQVITQGTPLPPSTIGFYSTFQQTSQIENSPLGAFMTAQSIYGLYQNISTSGFVVTSNISTIYTPSSIGLLSSYTSTITSSFVRSYSTLAILQNFPTGEVRLTPSSLLLQHADKIELDTKPFPVFTTLTPGLSTIVSSLYTYEAITDGAKYSEVGQIVQTIVPVVETLSSFFLSTGQIGGNTVSTLTSSFFSTLVSQTSFTSTIYNQMLLNSNAVSTPRILTSSITSQILTYNQTRQPFIQYSTINTTGSSGNQPIVLPVPYRDLNFCAFATMLDNLPAQVASDITSESTFTIYWSQGGGGSHKIAWNTMGDVF